MAEAPVTRQVSKHRLELGTRTSTHEHVSLQDVEDCFIYDRRGSSLRFRHLYEDRKCIIIFLRSFLCYTSKEYVDDLSKIPKEVLEEAGVRLVLIGQSACRHIETFSSLTGFPYEIFVDPERCIYGGLGMRTEERFSVSAHTSPHVKSGLLLGHMKSVWRAMTSPAFDFQGDLQQQGGALIVGPGPRVHVLHLDMNRLDHMPIDWLLQLAGVRQTVDFSDGPKVIHV